MKKRIVSVVVPVHNCEKYIDICLDSIVNQTYSFLDIIIVDDCSNDSSYQKCCRWKERDNRIKLVRLVQNGGVSEARNKGLDISIGDYVCFIDADDFIERNYIECFIKKIAESDIVISGYNRIDADKVYPQILSEMGEISREFLFYHMLCTGYIQSSCWNKIFKMDYIRDNGIKFQSDIKIGEDMVFLIRYLKECHTYIYIPMPLYNYRKNPTSALQNVYHGKSKLDSEISGLSAVTVLNEMTKDENQYIRNCVSFRCIRTCVWTMLQAIFARYKNKSFFRELCQISRKNILYSFRIKLKRAPERLVGLCIAVSPEIVYCMGRWVLHYRKEFISKYLR